MADLSKCEKVSRGTLYEIGYKYLCDNFHKFKEANKIKVAIAILNIFEKDDSKTKADMRQIVVMNEIKRGETPMRFNIGEPEHANSDPS